MMRFHFVIFIAAGLPFVVIQHTRAAEALLIPEVITREVGIHVGGVQTPDIKYLETREVALFNGAEPEPPYRMVETREVSLVVSDPTPPPRIDDFYVTISPTGSSVTLDWSKYNSYAVRDVVRYEIYYSSSPFTDITGMTPFATVGGESFSWSRDGFPEWQDHYFAVVPVDGMGNRVTEVIYSAAYPLMPEVITREVGIFVGEEPSFQGAPIFTRGGGVQYLVPADGGLGDSWKLPSFSPAGWLAGPSGLGFNLQQGIGVRIVKQNTSLYGSVTNLATADALLAAPPGSDRISQEYSAVLPTLNLLGDNGGDGHYPNNTTVNLADRNHYAVKATGYIRIPVQGVYTFGLNSDDGGRIRIDGVAVMTDDSNHGPTDHLGSVSLAAGIHSFEVVMWEQGGGDEVEFYAAPGSFDSWTSNFLLVGDVAAGGLEAFTSVFSFARNQDAVETNVEGVMRNVNASILMRQSFEIADLNAIKRLYLNMVYSDGFVAYLNGTEIARRNAPASLTFDSTATTARPAGDAFLPETFDLTPVKSMLLQGTNVLAIQGLNDSAEDGVFAILSELYASGSDSGAEGTKQVTTREVSLVVSDPTPPPSIDDFSVTISPNGSSVTLDWSKYNPYAVRDVVRYEIYYSSSPFTDITGMTPFATVGGESFSWSRDGFPEWQDHYFAVVPVDGMGNRVTEVIYSAAYPLMPEVITREQGIFVGQWPEPLSGIEQIPIANSGFESPDFGGYTYWGQMNESQKTAFSWSAAGNQLTGGLGPAVFNNGDAWGYQNVPEGHQGLSLQGNSSVEISLQVNSPGDYTLSWHAASRGGQVNPYVVQFDGLNLSEEKSTNNPAWGKQALPVNVATAGTHLLKFQALSTSGDNSVGIDAISLSRNVTVGVRPFNDFREVVSREVGIVVADDTTPAAVTGPDKSFRADVSRTRYGRVNLKWEDYDLWAQRDVVRYRIYYSDHFFSNVADANLAGFSQDGQMTAAVDGLKEKKVFYFAVVAEDSSGNFNPVVYSRSTKEPIPTLFEYALSVVKTGSEDLADLGITWSIEADALSYRYKRRNIALQAGTEYHVEWSTDLENWQESGVTQSVVSDDGHVQQVVATVSRTGKDKMFIRLKVVAPK